MLDQSVRAVEVIVSDNASTDDTASVVASFGDERVHYVRNEANIGATANISRGLELGSAPFLMILCDDDFLLPGSLERRIPLFESDPMIDMVHCALRFQVFAPDGSLVGEVDSAWGAGSRDTVSSGSEVVRRLLSEPFFISHANALIRRSAIGDVRALDADGAAEDLGMFLRLAYRARNVAYVPEPLVCARVHGAANSVEGRTTFTGDSYEPTILSAVQNRQVKERFLDELERNGADIRTLRSASRALDRRVLQSLLHRTLTAAGGRSLRPIVDVGRVDPIALIAPRGIKAIAAGALGPGRYDRAKTALSSLRARFET